MTQGFVLFGLVFGIFLVAFWVDRKTKKDARRDVELFARHFPGKCLICSYRRYGLGNGFVDPRSPAQKHHCIGGECP